MHTMPVQTLARALRVDALNRLSVTGGDGEENKGRKIYANADIYDICGLDSYGRPVEK